jgi:mRNA interferase MazF
VRGSGYLPDRRDILFLDIEIPDHGTGPDRGAGPAHDTARGPALVISPKAYNEAAGRILALPIAAEPRGYPFETPLPHGLGISGAALCDRLRSLPWRNARPEFTARMPRVEMEEVLAKVRVLVE